MSQNKPKTVSIMMDIETVDFYKAVAKLANTTMNQAMVVSLAMYLQTHKDTKNARKSNRKKRK